MSVGVMLFAFNDVWLRRIADDIGLVEAVWGRSILLLGLIAPLLRRSDWALLPNVRNTRLQLARSLFPIIGAFLMLIAMGRIPAVDATATFFMAPIIAVLLAGVLLKERIGAEKWIALALGFAGMLVVVRPGSGAFELGHVAALATAFSVALYQIFTRLVSRTSSARLTLFFMATTATVLTSLAVPLTWTLPQTSTWLHLVGVTIVYAAGHAMYIVAHSRTEASRLAPFVYFQLAGSIAGGFLFYGQVPQIHALLGGALIALGGCVALLPLRRRVAPTA